MRAPPACGTATSSGALAVASQTVQRLSRLSPMPDQSSGLRASSLPLRLVSRYLSGSSTLTATAPALPVAAGCRRTVASAPTAMVRGVMKPSAVLSQAFRGPGRVASPHFLPSHEPLAMSVQKAEGDSPL